MTVDFDFTPNRVKRIRVALGMDQTKFAERLGASKNMVSRWETGANMPTQARMLKALLEAEAEVADVV